MKIDEYTIKARLFPSIIILFPFLIFILNSNISELDCLLEKIFKMKIVGNISVSLVLLYLLSQCNRFLGKFVFERGLFNNEMDMPTTIFMLFSDPTYSINYKQQVRTKVEKDFKIQMPTEKDEITDLADSKRRIVEVVGLMRQKVKNGRLLLQHNIEYGFFRNLIGGAMLGLVMSCIDSVYFYCQEDDTLMGISLLLVFAFSILLILSKIIILNLGMMYAKRLFQEYLQK